MTERQDRYIEFLARINNLKNKEELANYIAEKIGETKETVLTKLNSDNAEFKSKVITILKEAQMKKKVENDVEEHYLICKKCGNEIRYLGNLKYFVCIFCDATDYEIKK